MTRPADEAADPSPTYRATTNRPAARTGVDPDMPQVVQTRRSLGAATRAGTDAGCVLCRQAADAGRNVTFAAVADLPVALEVPSAGQLLGIGRTRAYQMARDGTFPTRVIPIGRGYLVPTADLLRLLGVRLEPADTDERTDSSQSMNPDSCNDSDSSLTSFRSRASIDRRPADSAALQERRPFRLTAQRGRPGPPDAGGLKGPHEATT